MSIITGPTLTPLAIASLRKAAKWAKFLAILGLISAGLAILSFLMGRLAEVLDPKYSVWMIVLVIVISISCLIAYFQIFLFLYRFASGVKEAIEENDHALMESGFDNLKKYFKIQGEIAITVLAVIVGILVYAIIAVIFDM